MTWRKQPWASPPFKAERLPKRDWWLVADANGYNSAATDKGAVFMDQATAEALAGLWNAGKAPDER